MEISEQYRPCKEIADLYVDREGNFLYCGKPKAVIRPVSRHGKKLTARLTFRRGGKLMYYCAADLVASAFIPEYKNHDYIEYKDCDIHNIRADNLSIVTKKDYYAARLAIANYYHEQGTYQYQVKRIENTIADAQAVLHYFKTGDMSEVNKRVENYLFECLLSYCVKSLRLSEQTAYEYAADVIVQMYDILLSGHAICHLEYHCKELLLQRKRHKVYGVKGLVNKEIKLMIKGLNLTHIQEKYDVSII
ncbi:MAG: hypothetical protein SOX54_09080 [Prevotella sp.]|nr:hypothetical protein [Prevotella sp.]